MSIMGNIVMLVKQLLINNFFLNVIYGDKKLRTISSQEESTSKFRITRHKLL